MSAHIGYPVVWIAQGRTHAVWPSGEHSERDLANCVTFCGVVLTGKRLWGESEIGAAVTCQGCRRALSSRASDNPAAKRTLAASGE